MANVQSDQEVHMGIEYSASQLSLQEWFRGCSSFHVDLPSVTVRLANEDVASGGRPARL